MSVSGTDQTAKYLLGIVPLSGQDQQCPYRHDLKHIEVRSNQIYVTNNFWWSFWWSWQKGDSGLAYLLATCWQRRSQSEEPNLRSLLSSGLFAFPLSHGSRTAFFNTPKCVLQRRLLQAIAEKKLPGTLISIHYTDKRGWRQAANEPHAFQPVYLNITLRIPARL